MKNNIGMLAVLLLAIWAVLNFPVAIWIGAVLIILAFLSWVMRRNGDKRLWDPRALFVLGVCFVLWFVLMNVFVLPAHITATQYVPSPHP